MEDPESFLLQALLVVLLLLLGARYFFANWFRKVRRSLLSAFLMEYFGALVKLRLPLTQGIGSCSKMLSRGSRRDLSDVEQNLAEGMLIGDALASVPRRRKSVVGRALRKLESWQPFPQSRLITAAEAETLRIGEMSGNLAGAFKLVLGRRRRYEQIAPMDDRRLALPASGPDRRRQCADRPIYLHHSEVQTDIR